MYLNSIRWIKCSWKREFSHEMNALNGCLPNVIFDGVCVCFFSLCFVYHVKIMAFIHFGMMIKWIKLVRSMFRSVFFAVAKRTSWFIMFYSCRRHRLPSDSYTIIYNIIIGGVWRIEWCNGSSLGYRIARFCLNLNVKENGNFKVKMFGVVSRL